MSLMNATAPDQPKPLFSLRWVVAGVAAIIAALGAWYFLVARQDFSLLYDDLRPAEASAIVAELEKQSVHYRLADGGAQILVPAAQIDETRVKLASSDAPLNGLDGFELFDNSDLGLTEFAQKIRYQRALQGELSRTIMMMEGVAEARVHLSIPERTLFRGERRNAEAAVTLVMQGDENPNVARIDGVQRLIAASVSDLAPDDVVVLNARGEVLSSHTETTASQTQRFVAGAAASTLPSLDRVMAVVRAAIPNQSFEASVEPIPPELVGAEANGTSANPPPYVVRIRTSTPMTALETEAVVSALREANLVDRTSSGSVSIESASFSEAPILTAHAEADGPPSQTGERLSWLGVGAMVLLLGGLAGAGLWCWRRLARPRLSTEEQIKFADILSAQLQTTEHERA